jgi:hypothetical protein
LVLPALANRYVRLPGGALEPVENF